MKRLFAALLLLVSAQAYADLAIVNRSSFTKTNDTAYIQARYLDKVVVGSNSAGCLVIYNSTFTTSVVISSINLAVANIYDFANTSVSGIYYVTTGVTAGVTILYKK